MSIKVIAEAGVNHNGSLDLALELVKEAKKSGANSIKFQTFRSESLACFNAPLAKYQKNSESFNSQIDMLKSLELTNDEIIKVSRFCNENSIEFMSSPFGIEELHFLLDLGMQTIKIPSGEITNKPLLYEIGAVIRKKDIKVLLSTGMCNLGDIEKALEILRFKEEQEKITILHCVSSYPAPIEDLNLNVLKTLKKCFNCKVGYSDHSEKIIAPIISVALGASVIEKHLTIDKNLPGPDHKASINPMSFREMVSNIRESELMLGNGKKEIKDCELENKIVARRSIRSLKEIKKGSLILREDLIYQRPGDGISPMELEKVIGAKASKNYKSGDLIFDLNY